jgi:hypothetical protein
LTAAQCSVGRGKEREERRKKFDYFDLIKSELLRQRISALAEHTRNAKINKSDCEQEKKWAKVYSKAIHE